MKERVSTYVAHREQDNLCTRMVDLAPKSSLASFTSTVFINYITHFLLLQIHSNEIWTALFRAVVSFFIVHNRFFL